MKNIISNKVQDMQPSGIREFFDLVLGMKDVISLGVGEPDFVTPWPIREAGIFSLEQGFTSYTSNKGLMKLRLSVSRYLKNRFHLEYSPEDEILITVGVSEAYDLCLRAIINPGDKILVPSPSYVSYGPLVNLAGGTVVYIDTKSNGFKLTPKMLEKHIGTKGAGKKCKALVLNYPVNPTGVSYTKSELEDINRVLSKNGILCLSDEIYGDLTYEFNHTAYPTLTKARQRTVYFNGFSKSYAMTGWRVGYVCGPKDIIAAMTKIHQYTIMCVSITSQMAACEALMSSSERSISEMKREYHRRRNYIIKELNSLGLDCPMPEGAFYAFPSIKNTGLSSIDFAKKLLNEQKVAVVPGTAFGSPPGTGNNCEGHIRISYASSMENLKEAIVRIGNFLTQRTQ